LRKENCLLPLLDHQQEALGVCTFTLTGLEVVTLRLHCPLCVGAVTVQFDPGTTKNREGRVLVFGGIDDLRNV
jgi:hypothetical protein